jgi:dUTP pyrophosphatase
MPGEARILSLLPLGVKRLHSDAQLPTQADDGAAGLDLYAYLENPGFYGFIRPGDRVTIPTGIAIELPKGHVGLVCPRSGLARNHGITVLNAPGVIDESFRGEVNVLLVNHSLELFKLKHGDRIAQLVIVPVARVQIEVVETLSETTRGTGGFGSTGR